MLCPAKLLAHILEYCNGKSSGCQPDRKNSEYRYIRFHTPTVFALHRGVYCVLSRKEACMRQTNDPNTDLDDLIFDEEDGGPSER